MTERFSFDVDGERLTALAYHPKKPMGATFLLGHGASAGQRDTLITEYAAALAERGVLVVTYDFPFIERGQERPDRDEVLQAACRAAIVAARQCRPKNRLFVGGKSLGGRVASEVVEAGGEEEEIDDVAGVVILGYPLHPLDSPRHVARGASRGRAGARPLRSGNARSVRNAGRASSAARTPSERNRGPRRGRRRAFLHRHEARTPLHEKSQKPSKTKSRASCRAADRFHA
jgi:alpha-beta hydrolase superfamily lysophospholipase